MGTFTVTFGKLNDEKLDFIRERISVNNCEVCNEKASLKITEENVHVINICCGRFAEIIGASLTLRTINNYAIEFRGKFLNDFCVLENFIDAIIELHGFIYNLTPQEFFKKEIKEINTRERKELFKFCLDKYTELTKQNTNKIWGNINNLFEIRNQLAHWSTDSSESGLELIKKNKIRFVNMRQMEIIDEAIFDSKKVEIQINKAKNLVMELVVIFRYYRKFWKTQNGL
jgi:hypothetical protein